MRTSDVLAAPPHAEDEAAALTATSSGLFARASQLVDAFVRTPGSVVPRVAPAPKRAPAFAATPLPREQALGGVSEAEARPGAASAHDTASSGSSGSGGSSALGEYFVYYRWSQLYVFADRDVVARVRVSRMADGSVQADVRSVPSAYAPAGGKERGCVRMPYLRIEYRVSRRPCAKPSPQAAACECLGAQEQQSGQSGQPGQQAGGRSAVGCTAIDCLMAADFGGGVPKWMTKWAVARAQTSFLELDALLASHLAQLEAQRLAALQRSRGPLGALGALQGLGAVQLAGAIAAARARSAGAPGQPGPRPDLLRALGTRQPVAAAPSLSPGGTGVGAALRASVRGAEQLWRPRSKAPVAVTAARLGQTGRRVPSAKSKAGIYSPARSANPHLDYL